MRTLLAWALLACSVLAAEPQAPEPQFLTGTRLFRAGETEIVPFRIAKPAAAKCVYPLELGGDPGLFAVLLPPTVLPGRTLGYLRLEPLKQGRGTLRIGASTLAVEVGSAPVKQERPEIVTPVAGCDVWGTIEVGVELFSPQPDRDRRTVALRLPNGTELAAHALPVPPGECFRRFAVAVDADQLPSGIALLTPVLRDGNAPPIMGDPLWMNVVRPPAGRLLSGACAEVKGPRAVFAGPTDAPLEKDRQAAGGQCVSVAANVRNWCLELQIPTPGYYQLIMRVRGDEGGGALPSLGLRLNEEPVALAEARLADTAWHRLPIGTPMRLPAGDQIVTASYFNDFKFGPDKRGLYLDRYELLRLEGGNHAIATAPAMSMAGEEMATPAPAMEETMNPSGSDDVDMSEIGRPGTPLRVAFDRIVDGQTIDGPVFLHVRTWWQNAGHGPAPRTELRLNGVPQAAQTGADLFFRIAPGSFFPGANTVSVHAALPSGLEADAPPQRLFLKAAPAEAGPPRRLLRFPVGVKEWRGLLFGPPNPIDRPALFASPEAATLTLPETLYGHFQVIAETTNKQGPSVMAFGTGLPTSTPLGQGAVKTNYYGDLNLGTLALTANGPHALWVALHSPEPTAFSLRAVRLEEIAPLPPPPPARILYPVPGAVLDQAEAVVVEPFAAAGLNWVDVEADGQPLGMRLRPPRNLGPLVFPLATRGWKPGPHTLCVVSQGWSGAPVRSAALSVVVPEHPLTEPGPYARAVRLLDRFAYGPEPEELAALLSEGEEVWLRQRLGEDFSSPGLQALDKETGAAFPEERGAGAATRALHQVLLTGNPVRARFVLWTENHFSVWVDKVQQGPKWREHLRFWQEGVAPFSDLLRTSAASPAMLVYLDQYHSFAGKLNENYAREIMELHTVGVHGGYTQADVTTLAGLLNGWTLSTEAELEGPPTVAHFNVFRFDPLLNDGKERQVLGLEFPAAPPAERYDRVRMALEMLAAHPSAAAFVSRKLAEHYVGVPAPQPLVDRLSRLYLETGGDMEALLIAISQSPEFWKAPPRLAAPLDYGVKLERLGGAEPDPNQAGMLVDFLRQSGQGLFERASPDGYKEGDREYANANALLQRWQLARNLDARLATLLPGAWLDPKYVWDAAQNRRAVDFLALRLTGRLLSPASQQAAEEMLAHINDPPAQRAALLASFLCQLPETNFR